jgi:hypothetical protein
MLRESPKHSNPSSSSFSSFSSSSSSSYASSSGGRSTPPVSDSHIHPQQNQIPWQLVKLTIASIIQEMEHMLKEEHFDKLKFEYLLSFLKVVSNTLFPK